jgi:hypothetical protein
MACCVNDHCSSDTRQPDGRYSRVLWVSLVLNGGMFLTEIVAGLAAGSAALQADAVDFLSDAANYGIIRTPAIFSPFAAAVAISSRFFGTTVSACRSTPSDWSAASSSGRLRQMVSSSSHRRSLPICWRVLTGDIRSGRGGQKLWADCTIVTHCTIAGLQAPHLVIPSLAMSATDSLPDDVETLQRLLRIRDAELGRARAQALSAEALIAHLRLAIEKMRRELLWPASRAQGAASRPDGARVERTRSCGCRR